LVKRKHEGTYLFLLLVLLISFLFVSQPFLRLLPFSLLPGPEGVDMYFYGVQFPGSTRIYRASSMDTLPQDESDGMQFKWGTTQTHVVTISRDKASGEPLGGFFWNGPWWWYDHDTGRLRSEHERAALMTDDPLGYGSRITRLEYYVQKWTENNTVYWRKYVAYVIPADITLEISVSEGLYNWEGLKLWYVLDNIVWVNAFTSQPLEDPNPPEGAILSAYEFRGAFPIIAWVGGYTPWQWYDEANDVWKENPPSTAALKHTDLDPSYEGRVIDLYTEPGQRYDLLLSADVISDPSLLQQAVAEGLPDPRFSRHAYFYITLNTLGPYVDPEAMYAWSYTAWYPVVHYRIRTLWVVYGEFVYAWTTEEEQKHQYEFENRTSTQETVWDFWESFRMFTGIDVKGFLAWLNSPAGIFTAMILSAVIIFMIILVLLAYSGALGPIIMYLISRRRALRLKTGLGPPHFSFR
jgi:hypothetical protein